MLLIQQDCSLGCLVWLMCLFLRLINFCPVSTEAFIMIGATWILVDLRDLLDRTTKQTRQYSSHLVPPTYLPLLVSFCFPPPFPGFGIALSSGWLLPLLLSLHRLLPLLHQLPLLQLLQLRVEVGVLLHLLQIWSDGYLTPRLTLSGLTLPVFSL